MTQDEINEWNKNKPTTHDESQMGYGRGDYEALKKQVKSKKRSKCTRWWSRLG